MDGDGKENSLAPVLLFENPGNCQELAARLTNTVSLPLQRFFYKNMCNALCMVERFMRTEVAAFLKSRGNFERKQVQETF